MTLEIALSLLAFSAPLTAAIVKLLPTKNGNGKYVPVREYDSFRTDLGDKLVCIDGKLRSLDTTVQELSTYVKTHLN